MPKQRGNQLSEEICLAISREPNPPEVSGFEAPAEKSVGCPCDLKVTVGVDVGSIRKLDRAQDALTPQCVELFVAET